MDAYNPYCPSCGVEIDFLDHYDCYDDGDLAIFKARGVCPKCKRGYRWEDVYSLTSFQYLEEED